MIAWIVLAALLGGAWRFCDGRGYGPGWLRVVACVALTVLCLVPLDPPGWALTLLTCGFSLIWFPRQKNREELDDMTLRWGAPILAFGCVMALVSASWHPAAVMGVASVIVPALVWAGVHLPKLQFTVRGFTVDSSATTETVAGAAAFGALAWAASI